MKRVLLVADVDQTLLKTHKVGFELWKLILDHFRKDFPFKTTTEFALAAMLPWECFLHICGLHVEQSAEINAVAATHTARLHLEYAEWFEGVRETLHEIMADDQLVLTFATNNIAPAFGETMHNAGLSNVPMHDSMETHAGKYKPEPDMILDHVGGRDDISAIVVAGDARSDLYAAGRARNISTIPVIASWARYGSLRNSLDMHGLHDHEFCLRTVADFKRLPALMRTLLP